MKKLSLTALFEEFFVQHGEKIWKNCTLIGAKHLVVDERIYCLKKNGKLNYPMALEYCRKLDATLPLPMSLLEFEAFSNFTSPYNTWIGINDPSNSGKKENWRDAQNNAPAYVK